jgi:hypothetical protein
VNFRRRSLIDARLLFGGSDPVGSRPRHHCIKYTVTSDERMKERRRDMQQNQGEEGESQVEVGVPKQRMQAVALRQDRWKMHAPTG